MTPKQFIKYTKWLDKNNLAICDGISSNMSFFDILYPLFIVSGVTLFMSALYYWLDIKLKVRGKK